MTIQEALRSSGLDSLDAEVILAHILGVSREQLIICSQNRIDDDMLQTCTTHMQRRKRGEPVAYIIGQKEFYGRDFLVTPDVLIPRPATEGLIDLTLHVLKTGEDDVRKTDTDIVAVAKLFSKVEHVRTVIDIGTGSGCIAITIALERPDLRVIATDISEAALKIATQNAKQLNADIDFRLGNLLEPIQNVSEPFLIVSNPPYIPSSETLPQDVYEYEPHSALFSGDDGVNHLQQIVKYASKHPFCCGICIECKTDQCLALA